MPAEPCLSMAPQSLVPPSSWFFRPGRTQEKWVLASASSSSGWEGVRRRGWLGLWLQAAPLTPETAGWPGPRARAILLWKAVAEMAWAGDMGAMLCRALSLAAWSWGDIGREGLSSGHYGMCGRGGVGACAQGSCPNASGQSPGQGPGGSGSRPCCAMNLVCDEHRSLGSSDQFPPLPRGEILVQSILLEFKGLGKPPARRCLHGDILRSLLVLVSLRAPAAGIGPGSQKMILHKHVRALLRQESSSAATRAVCRSGTVSSGPTCPSPAPWVSPCTVDTQGTPAFYVAGVNTCYFPSMGPKTPKNRFSLQRL